MNPYGNPLDPFGVSIPGDPMEEVLALQSYAMAEADAAAACLSTVSIVQPSCPSNQSVIVNCPSAESKIVIGDATPR